MELISPSESAEASVLSWLIDDRPEGHCVDVAAGLGAYAVAIASLGWQCHAVDLTETLNGFVRIRARTANVLSRVTFFQGYAPDVIDVMQTYHALVDGGLFVSHAPDDRATYVAWMARVLLPSARCAIRVPDVHAVDATANLARRSTSIGAIIDELKHDFLLDTTFDETPAGSTQKPACWLCLKRRNGSA